ncbi:MAG: endonuclease III [Rhodothermales bacterium]
MKRSERARIAIEELRKIIPAPETELEHEDPYELIVAVILSAQCTDKRVNMVTPALFEAFPTINRMAEAQVEDIFPFIRSVSFPNNKSRHLSGMARKVVQEYVGKVPDTVDELVKLPGVGRKSAQVVAAVAYQRDTLAVDTHVFRVANRIGITRNADTPLKVERQLKRIVQREDWSEAHHLFILHGRYTCTARNPNCDACPVTHACDYRTRLQALPAPVEGLRSSDGRFYCKTRGHYFDRGDLQTDRDGTEQICCPRCGSMNVFHTRTGRSAKKARDYRA